MMIIDSQVHVYGPNTPERPWVVSANMPHMRESMTADHLLTAMDEAGVNRAVLVPAGRDADSHDLCLAAAQAHPDRFAVMGRVPIEQPDAPLRLEQLFAKSHGMLGIRLAITRHARHLLSAGTIDAFWKAMERLGIPVMMYAPGLLPEIGDLARAYPGLNLILDHMNFSEAMKGTAQIGETVSAVLDLAPLENVSVKVSALPCYSSELYPYRDMQQHARRVIERFGARRSFWGTDYSRLPCSYREAITMFTEEMPFLSRDDLAWIMGRALAEKIGWPIAG